MNKKLSKAFGIFFLLAELALVPKAIDLMLNQHLALLPPLRLVMLAMTFGSIALCIVMSFSSMSEHDSFPTETFLFELMVFLCALAPMTDLITRALDSAGRPRLNMLVNTGFYLIGISIAYVLMLYEFRIIGARKKPALIRIRNAATVLMILDGLATLLNVRFGYFFTITESGAYQSAPYFWLAYTAPFLIVAATVVVAAREMKPGRQQRAFLSFWIFGVLLSVQQIWQSELTLQYTGYTLSLIVIYINVQSELDAALAASWQEAEDED